MIRYTYDHDAGFALWETDEEYRNTMEDYYLSVTGHPAFHIHADGFYTDYGDGLTYLDYTLNRRGVPEVSASLEAETDHRFVGVVMSASDAPEPPWVTRGCCVVTWDNEDLAE